MDFVHRKKTERSTMKSLNYFVLVTLIALFSGSCRKIQQLPDVPHIEFRSFAVSDTLNLLDYTNKTGKLVFYFEDGDGDLGLDPAEFSNSDDTVNLFLTLFRKIGEDMVQVPDSGDLLKPGNYTIPYLESPSQTKILKGTISVLIDYTFYNTADNDTFIYTFFIKDRAGNISNADTTVEIPLSYNGLYKKPEN